MTGKRDCLDAGSRYLRATEESWEIEEALKQGVFLEILQFSKTLSENVCTRKFQEGEIASLTAVGRGKRGQNLMSSNPVQCVLLSGLNSCNSSSYDGRIHSTIPPMITGLSMLNRLVEAIQ